jgi:hypothetical protein
MRDSRICLTLIAGLLLGFAGSLQAADPVLVQFETSAGAFIVQLDPERAPSASKTSSSTSTRVSMRGPSSIAWSMAS